MNLQYSEESKRQVLEIDVIEAGGISQNENVSNFSGGHTGLSVSWGVPSTPHRSKTGAGRDT